MSKMTQALGLLGLLMFANTAWAGVELQDFSIDPPPPDAQPLPRAPVVAINPPPHDSRVGTAPGVADTEGGAATYRVPLVVPPGRAGLEPELALAYHSRGGNGLGGMGVSLAGLGSIHRCPQTIEQDGAARAVKYDANDRLCLDGQRLVLASGTTYGVSGAVYRTEVDDFARVTQIGALTGTTACFKVELKSGRIRSYGSPVSGAACSVSTRNSRVQPTGAPATLSWLLEKEEDRVGNNVFYAYWNFGNGEVLISSIDYTGFGVAIGGRRVTFVHSPRPTSTSAGVIDNDVSASYLAGGLTMQTQRLTQIDTWVGSEHVRAYKLDYADPDQKNRSVSQYSGRSLLQSLTECAYHPTQTPAETCHPSTGFFWEDGPVTYTLRQPVVPSLPTLAELRGTLTTGPSDPSPAPDQRLKTVGDLDGDGGQEVLLTVGAGQTAKSYLLKPRPDRTFAAAVNVTDLGIGSARWNFVDFDGDGRADIARIRTSSDGLLHLWTWKLDRGGWSTDPNALFRDVATTIPHTASQYPSYYADFDGDGRTDVLFSTTDPVCGSDSSGAKWRLKVYLNRIQGSLAGGAVANFVLATETNGPLCLSRAFSNGQPIYSEAAFRANDFDGDGRADIFIDGGNPPNRQRLVYVRSGGADAVTYESVPMATIGLTADEMTPSSPSAATEKIVHWIDINGDGLEDFVFAQTNGTGTVPSYRWIVRLNKGGTLSAAIATDSVAGLGTWGNTLSGGAPVGTQFRYSSKIAPIDVDSDGRQELLVPVRIGAMYCSRYVVPRPDGQQCSLVTDSTQAGGAMTPCDRVTLCPVDPVSGNEIVTNVASVYNAYAKDSPGWDQSTYVMHPLRFVVGAVNGATGLPTITVQEVQKDLYGDQVDDLYGDGLTDVLTSIGCADCVAYANNATPNTPSTLPDGTSVSSLVDQAKLFANENVGIGTQEVRPPELMHATFNGVADWAAWVYAPLGQPTQTSSVQPVPLYTLGSGTPYVDARHHYFTSSMPVVELMTQSTAVIVKDDPTVAAGVRSRIFGYQEAMYHRLGRGFQGFRKITETTWVGDDLAARRQQVATTYHQKFPLTGKVQSVTLSDPAHPTTPYRTQTWTWRCNLANRAELCPGDGSAPTAPLANTVYAPYLDRQLVQDFDLADAESGLSSLAGQADTVNAASAAATASGWDAYGNLKNQVVERRDGGSGDAFVASQTVTTTSTYTPDATAWWLDKLTGRTVSTAISYATGHALPAGASAPARSVTTTYQWNADRAPLSQTVQPGVANQELVTTWAYPTTSYGLPTSVSVSGLAVAPSPRTTQWIYTGDGTIAAADGYFVLETTNAANQTTKTERRPRDGGVARAIDPNGLETVFNADAFGRTYRTDYLDAAGGTLLPPQYTSWTACADGSCPGGYGEGVGEDLAAWRVTTTQAGHPATATWYDKLGRVVKNVVSGFNGPVQTLTEYDVMGTVKRTSAPHYSNNTAYWTWFNEYDRLNRVTQKTSPGTEFDPLHGNVRTIYAYTGTKTAIKVHAGAVSDTCASTTNLCMDMTRSYDVLGRLVKTTQALNGSASYATSKYWYDGAGNPVAAQDAEEHVTRASYDALGRRTQVVDPDAGTSSFTYDALGELLTRSDARGVVTTNQYDALGRPVRRTAVPPASAPAGLAGDTVLDTWSYDPANGIGQPAMQVRLRGANRTSPDTNPEVWRESYTYEANTSRPSTTTTHNAESTLQVFTATAHYDSAGRPDVTTYPSGLAVRRGYTDQGYLKRLGNDATGVEYWSASAANAWGHITQESWSSVGGSHKDYGSTGQTSQKSWNGTGGSDQVTYGYDSFGNLVSQERSLSGGGAPKESYVYDGLQRLTQASRPGSSISYGYAPNGNLTSKTDYSTPAANAYQYGGNGCGPHAVSQVQRTLGAATFQCDAAGNLIGGSTIQATYDAWNLPRTLTRTQIVPGTPPCRRSDTIFCSGFESVPTTTTSSSTSWTYASDGSRSSELSLRGLRLYGRDGYEQIGAVKVHELGPVVVTRSGTTDTVTAVLKDRLDSTVATIDTAVNRRSYDPFGAARNGDYSPRPNGTLNLAGTIHGFTGHTHADDVALIHMNGRIYDPNLGRFLSVDPIVQFPASTQSLNPYSYLMNNPFAGTDPSGFCMAETGTHIKTCVDVQENYSDGSTKNLGSYNLRSAGDWARASGVALNSNGADAQTIKGPSSAPISGNTNEIGTNGRTDGGIPSNVISACQGYTLPTSCGGRSNDQAIERSATERVATGGQLNPDFHNSDVAAETIDSDAGVVTSLRYKGNVDDAIVNRAARNWSGDGLTMTPVRKADTDSALVINMRSTPQFASDLCLASCTNAYYIGGRTDISGRTIYINQDHSRSVQKDSLTHELGHYFFGRGHPQRDGDFLYRGVMDYSRQRVNSLDRSHYINLYRKSHDENDQ